MQLNFFDKLGILAIFGLIMIFIFRICTFIKPRQKCQSDVIFTKSKKIELSMKLLRKNIRLHSTPMEQRSLKIIEKLINSATQSIYVAVFIMTSKDLAQLLINARIRGVTVIVFLNKNHEKRSQLLQETIVQEMTKYGIIVEKYDGKMMHLKLCLIDVPSSVLPSGNRPIRISKNEIQTVHGIHRIPLNIPKQGLVITGSMNWTNSGLRHNEENFTISIEEKMCKISIARFEDLWEGTNEIKETKLQIEEDPSVSNDEADEYYEDTCDDGIN